MWNEESILIALLKADLSSLIFPSCVLLSDYYGQREGNFSTVHGPRDRARESASPRFSHSLPYGSLTFIVYLRQCSPSIRSIAREIGSHMDRCARSFKYKCDEPLNFAFCNNPAAKVRRIGAIRRECISTRVDDDDTRRRVQICDLATAGRVAMYGETAAAFAATGRTPVKIFTEIETM